MMERELNLIYVIATSVLTLYNTIFRYIEGSTRTLREEFLNIHLDLLATDTEEFNSKLMEN